MLECHGRWEAARYACEHSLIVPGFWPNLLIDLARGIHLLSWQYCLNMFSLAPFHLHSGQVKSDNGSVVFGSCAHYINDRLQLVSVLVFFPKDFVWLCWGNILDNLGQEDGLLWGVTKRDVRCIVHLGEKGLNPPHQIAVPVISSCSSLHSLSMPVLKESFSMASANSQSLSSFPAILLLCHRIILNIFFPLQILSVALKLLVHSYPLSTLRSFSYFSV